MEITHYDSIADYERSIAAEDNPRPLRDAAELATGKPCDLEGWPCTVLTIQGVNKEGCLDGLLTHTIIIPDERGTCGWERANDGWHLTDGDPRDGLTSLGCVIDLVRSSDKSADGAEIAYCAQKICDVLG